MLLWLPSSRPFLYGQWTWRWKCIWRMSSASQEHETGQFMQLLLPFLLTLALTPAGRAGKDLGIRKDLLRWWTRPTWSWGDLLHWHFEYIKRRPILFRQISPLLHLSIAIPLSVTFSAIELSSVFSKRKATCVPSCCECGPSKAAS